MTEEFAKLVSEPRLSKYRRATDDPELVPDLYAMDMRLSAAAFKALHMAEVVVRNAMDRELRRWNAAAGHGEAWTTNPAGLLKSCFYDDAADLKEAKRKAEKAVTSRDVLHDDVLAQLSFGAWRYLMPPNRAHHAKDRIWDEAISHAFANRSPNSPRSSLTKSVSIIYDLRNRVAHHEPVFHLDLQAKRRNIKDVIDAVSREARRWFTTNDEFSAMITEFQQFAKEKNLTLPLPH